MTDGKDERKKQKKSGPAAGGAAGGLCVLTDLEPDDVQALLAGLALAGSQLQLRGLIVGEGPDLAMKVRRAQRLLAELGALGLVPRDGSVWVRAGHESTVSNYPAEGAEWQLSARDAEHAAARAAVAKDAREGEPPLETFFGSVFAENQEAAPVLWVLKPPRELLRLLADHERLARQWLARTTLLVYGGFNLRCVLSRVRPTESRQALGALWACCRRVVLYESFHATGQANSVNPDNAPGLYKALRAATTPVAAPTGESEIAAAAAAAKDETENVGARPNGYLAGLLRLIEGWNRYIYDDSIHTCAELHERALQAARAQGLKRSGSGAGEGESPKVSQSSSSSTVAELKLLEQWRADLGSLDAAAQAQFDRNLKCAQQVQPYVESQMVLADQALIALFYGSKSVQPVPIELRIDDRGNSVYRTPSSGRSEAQSTNIVAYWTRPPPPPPGAGASEHEVAAALEAAQKAVFDEAVGLLTLAVELA